MVDTISEKISFSLLSCVWLVFTFLFSVMCSITSIIFHLDTVFPLAAIGWVHHEDAFLNSHLIGLGWRN